ncbi:protealysin inhibitor emfourin [Halomonas sp. HP20-15]|uniref:protealysin inhibitor emfourin n=1 Tax=Halomonas sp. HP20-15 TaxID=3085901 RepID=UPI002980C16C|nr:protealysin inhibitor emfourin [Halomonas sp. HP20-15]MDW5378218.1 protealysin inhibitor emfourin [Halomonas sp. HP20-15]
MSDAHDPSRPALGPRSRLMIRREGGLAHFPGLAEPRCIEGDKCTPGQRRWLESLLAAALRDAIEDEATGADRRFFQLTIDECGDGEAASAPRWRLVIDETRAPRSLVTLWRHGELGEEPDDE